MQATVIVHLERELKELTRRQETLTRIIADLRKLDAPMNTDKPRTKKAKVKTPPPPGREADPHPGREAGRDRITPEGGGAQGLRDRRAGRGVRADGAERQGEDGGMTR